MPRAHAALKRHGLLKEQLFRVSDGRIPLKTLMIGFIREKRGRNKLYFINVIYIRRFLNCTLYVEKQVVT